MSERQPNPPIDRRFRIVPTAVLMALLSCQTSTAEESAQSELTAFHAACAAANAVLSSQGGDGILDEIIRSEVRRHTEAARLLGATDDDLKQFIEMMFAEYNAGRLSWEEITEFAYQCTELHSP